MLDNTCKHGIWAMFCTACKHQKLMQWLHDSDKDGDHNGGSGATTQDEVVELRSQLAARERELEEANHLLGLAADAMNWKWKSLEGRIREFLTRHQARKETT